MNDLKSIIAQLEQQRAAIDRALSALREISGSGNRPAERSAAAGITKVRKKRRLTPEGRERIAEATRRRWAAKRAAEGTPQAEPKVAGRRKRAKKKRAGAKSV